MTILFTCSGRRNYLLRFFRENLKEDDKIIAVDADITAASLPFANIALKVPDIYSEFYVETITEICEKYRVDILIPLNDLELPILAEHRSRFNKTSVKVLVSEKEIIETCSDKLKTHRFIEDIGLLSPFTTVGFDNALSYYKVQKETNSIVIKPRWGSASIGIYYPENESELLIYNQLANNHVRKSILNNISSIEIEKSILYQQRLSGEEYGLDIINDLNGNFVTTIIRKKLSMRAGETDKATIIRNEDLFFIGMKIGTNQKHIGNLDCDIIRHNNKLYVLELNPRFGGGYPFSQMAGVNLPGAILEWHKGIVADKSFFEHKTDVTFAKYDSLTETLHSEKNNSTD